MARCLRCYKFLLFASGSGYCKDCIIAVRREEALKNEELRKQREREEEKRKSEEAHRKKEEELRRKTEEERRRKEKSGRCSQNGPRWNGYYISSTIYEHDDYGRPIEYNMAIRFWGNDECNVQTFSSLDAYESNILTALELTPMIYGDRYSQNGNIITIQTNKPYSPSLEITGSLSSDARTFSVSRVSYVQKSISLRFHEIDVEYGKRIGYLWEEAKL